MSIERSFPVFSPYLCALVVFSVLRFAFLGYHYSLFDSENGTVIIRALLSGVLLDSSVAASALFLVRIGSLFIQALSREFAARVHSWALHACFSLFFFINLADIIYFEQFDTRLNVLFLDSLNQMGPILKTIVISFPVLPVIIIWIVVVAIFTVFNRFLTRRVTCRLCERFHKTYSIMSLVILAGLSFLWTPEPFWRTSLFSVSNQALNQLSLNGVYTLIKAADQKITLHQEAANASYNFGPDSVAIASLRAMIFDDGEDSVSTIYPMTRKIRHPHTLAIEKPNIVIIVMESFTAIHIGSLKSGEPSWSPGFDSLAAQGILFTQFYAHGTRTHHGIVSTASSFPSVLGTALTRRRGTDSFYTLGEILKRHGYSTFFFYGYDHHFDHMGSFMKQGGFDAIVDQNDFDSIRFTGAWGASDEDLFDKVHHDLLQQPAGTPFLSVILTSTNHPPRVVPEYFLQNHPEYRNDEARSAFAYSDYALSRFIADARSGPYFKNTIFVIVADHGVLEGERDRSLKRFHIPCLIYAPYLIDTPRIINTVAAQADIGTTLLHLIGYPGVFHFLGRNVLDMDASEGFAVMRDDHTVFYRFGDLVLVRDVRDTVSALHPVDSFSRMLDHVTISNDTLRTRMNWELERYLQGAYFLFENGKYRISSASDRHL